MIFYAYFFLELQPQMRGWLMASIDGSKIGIVPANYVKILGRSNGEAQPSTSGISRTTGVSGPSVVSRPPNMESSNLSSVDLEKAYAGYQMPETTPSSLPETSPSSSSVNLSTSVPTTSNQQTLLEKGDDYMNALLNNEPLAPEQNNSGS